MSHQERRIAFGILANRYGDARRDRTVFVRDEAAILRAVAAGELLTTEGATLAGIVENRRKAIETTELEARIAALERKQ